MQNVIKGHAIFLCSFINHTWLEMFDGNFLIILNYFKKSVNYSYNITTISNLLISITILLTSLEDKRPYATR